MTQTLGSIGVYRILNAYLYKYDESIDTTNSDKSTLDIKHLITAITISESLESPSMSISIRVFDNIGILESFPLIGEERIVLNIQEEMTNTVITLYLFVASVNTMIPHENLEGITYNLELLTKSSFLSKFKKVVAPFSKTASEIAKDIFENNYDNIGRNIVDGVEEKIDNTVNEVLGLGGSSEYTIYKMENETGRSFTVENTDVEIRCVIPNMIPDRAMDFIAARAVNLTSSKSNSFKFFETKMGFFFASDEMLIRQAMNNEKFKSVKKLYYHNSYDLKPEKTNNQINKVKSVQILRYSDNLDELFSGSYNSKINELDIVYGRVNEITFDYNDAEKDFGQGLASERHSKKYMETMFNENNQVNYYMIKNYDSINNVQLAGEQMFGKMFLQRNSYTNRIASTHLSCKIDGRLDLSVGDIIDFTVNEFKASDQSVKSEKFSGKYLISSLSHFFEHGRFETQFTLIKYGWDKTGANNENKRIDEVLK